MRRIYLYFGFLTIVVIGFIGYKYLYKSHRIIGDEKAIFSATSLALQSEYQNDITATTVKYLDKVVQVEGKVSDVEHSNFTLDDVILCYADTVTMKKVHLGVRLKVKGRSIGYDELLEYVKLDFVKILTD